MGVPVELRAELRHLDLTVIDVADDERMEDFLNLPVDGLENVDLGWGHRPVSLIARCAAYLDSRSHGVHDLLRRIVEIVRRNHIESRVAKNFLAEVDVGALQAHHKRNLKAHFLHSRNHALSDDVATHDAAENIDQNAL